MWSARRAIMSWPHLHPGAKLVWLILADEVYSSNFDRKSQASLARLAGLSLRQFRRHLAALVKAKLVGFRPDLGRQNYTWLLYADLFASCSPRTPVNSVLGGRTEMTGGVGHKRPTQRNYQRTYQRNGAPFGRSDPTGSQEPSNGRRKDTAFPQSFPQSENGAEKIPPGTLRVTRQAYPFFTTLNKHEQRARYADAQRCVDQIRHLEEAERDPDPKIQRAAAGELKAWRAQLSTLGFYITPDERTRR